MEHAHAAALMMAAAAAFAAAVASHAYEDAGRAARGDAAGAGSVHVHVDVAGVRPAVAALAVANAGPAAVVSVNATACGASGLLGRAAGDADWSLRAGSSASVAWAAPCDAGPVLARVEYEMADGSSAAVLRRACAGGAGDGRECAGGGGGGWGAGGGALPPAATLPPQPPPAPDALPAPSVASCTVSGLAATVCFNGSAAAAAYGISRLLVPGPAEYGLVGTVAAPEGGGNGNGNRSVAACHADMAPSGSATATYAISALPSGNSGNGGSSSGGGAGASPPSRTARADFAAQQCYVDTPRGERVGSPSGPPAPAPAARSDYRIAMYTGLASTPLTVQASFGPDVHVVERLADGTWSRLGYAPSHPRDALSEHLPAELVARSASGDADVRYVRADLLRYLDAFWGSRP